MFCKNVVTLVRWMCKNYSTLVCLSGIVAIAATPFFFFSLVFRLYFFFLLNIYKNAHIYCYTITINFTIFLYNKSSYATTVLWHCASRVLTLCSTIAATVFFFSPVIGLCFFSFKYWYKLTFILLYWHNKFHNIFTIIDVSISYQSK